MTRTQFLPLSNDQIVEFAPAAGAVAPHEEVSSRYSFVPTIQAVDLLRSVGWVPVLAKEAGVRNQDREGYQKHIIRFQMAGLEFSDQERVDLVMYNSHDRGCAFHLIASIWRKVCGNGLMVASELFNFSHKHIGFDNTAFMESAYKIAQGAGQIGNQVNHMKAIDLSPDERGVFARSAFKALPVSKRRGEGFKGGTMRKVLNIERRKDGDTQLILVTDIKGYVSFTRSAEPYPTDEEITAEFLNKELRHKYFQPYFS